MISKRYALIGLCVLVAAPSMAESADPFRSAPAILPDPFRSAPAAAPAKPASRPPRPTPENEPSREPVVSSLPIDAELSSWQTIATSTKAEDFDVYLRRFPQGRFSKLARERLAALPRLAPVPLGPTQAPATALPQGQTAAILGRYTSDAFYPSPFVLRITRIDADGKVFGSLDGFTGNYSTGHNFTYVFGEARRSENPSNVEKATLQGSRLVLLYGSGTRMELVYQDGVFSGSFENPKRPGSNTSVRFIKSFQQ